MSPLLSIVFLLFTFLIIPTTTLPTYPFTKPHQRPLGFTLLPSLPPSTTTTTLLNSHYPQIYNPLSFGTSLNSRRLLLQPTTTLTSSPDHSDSNSNPFPLPPNTHFLDDTSPQLLFQGPWSFIRSPSYISSTTRRASSSSSSFSSSSADEDNSLLPSLSLHFIGTSLTLIGSKSPSHGMFSISLNGVYHSTVDCYSSRWVDRQTLFHLDLFAEEEEGGKGKERKMELVVLGRKGRRSTGTEVSVDGVLVGKRSEGRRLGERRNVPGFLVGGKREFVKVGRRE